MMTVLFATHNGARWLPRVLEAFTALAPPPGGWKLIAVENASTDGTAGVLESFVPRLPLTVLRAPGPGKNRALNLGLTQAAGDLVVLTDDDVLPAADWLIQLRTCADANVAYDVFGGSIRPHFEADPPEWLLRWAPLDMAYGATRPDQPSGPASPDLVWGANMMIRRTVFDAGHRFDEQVGPIGANYGMDSETDFTRRLVQAGHACWFCPEAVVGHFVRREQMTRDWLIERTARFGRGLYRREAAAGAWSGPRLLGAAPALWRVLAGDGLRALRAQTSRDARWRLHTRLRLAETWGRIQESRALARQSHHREA